MKPETIALKRATCEMIKGVGGLEAAAQFCRPGKSVLSDYQSISRPDCFVALDVIADLEPLSREREGWPHVTQELCRTMGGTFVRLPETTIGTGDLYEMLACLAKEASDVAGSVLRGLADGKLDADERQDSVRETDELIRVAATLRALLLTIPEGK